MSLVDEIAVTGFVPRIAAVRATLGELDAALLRCMRNRELSIVVMHPMQRFHDIDSHYNFNSDMESCVLGLFNPDRNHIVLRDTSPATAAHETWHCLDFEMSSTPRRYFSEDDAALVRAHIKHSKDRMLISDYSGVNVKEFAAEAGRAILGYSASSTLAKRTDAQRLALIDPDVVTSIQTMIDELRNRYGSSTEAPPAVLGTAAPQSAYLVRSISA
jgi:hypothetical protein